MAAFLISSTFDPDRNVIVMKISGNITVSQLVAGYDEIFGHEQFKPNMHAIWDLTELDLKSFPINEVRKLPGELRKYMTRRGADYKAALVTNRSVDFQLLRLYTNFLKLIGTNFKIRTFRSKDDAYKWIDE